MPSSVPLTGALDIAAVAGVVATPTRWHVVTGAACTGKTTLIEWFAARGYRTIPESARAHFESQLAAGVPLASLRRHAPDLQRAIAELQQRYEDAADPAQVTFLDRAQPDSLTFYRLAGVDPAEVLPRCARHRYASVFLLDRLPVHRAHALGPEDEASSAFLDEWLARDYAALGYRVHRVPVLPTEQRGEHILAMLG